jgi:hypothetical protein
MSAGPTTVGELLMRTIDLTRSGEGERNRYPWRAVREFLIHLLSRRPILLTADGNPIAPTFGTLEKQVADLVPTWRLDLDGELLIELATRIPDLQLADANGIAGALFFDRSVEAESHVSATISHLLKEGRLSLSDNYPYGLMPPKQS